MERQVERDDLAGELGAEGDHGIVALSGEVGHEQRFASEHAAQDAAQPTAHVGVHADALLHPGEGAGFGVDGLAGAEVHSA